MDACLLVFRKFIGYAASNGHAAINTMPSLTKIAPRTAKVLKIVKTGGRIPAPDDEALRRVAGEPYQ
jgi:hypothetical protein